jgi:membrane fusion protein, copper/silver efflux system
MRWTPALTALTGLLLGATVVALLPGTTLFVSAAPASSAAPAAAGERWACAMMDFIGQQPGDCPVCGMKLQRVTAGDLTREQQRRMGVELTTIAAGPARLALRAAGIADYDHRYTHVVIPRVEGRIVKRYDATFGCCQEVAAGEPIIDLYSPAVIAAQGELAAAVKLGQPALIDALSERFTRWNLADVATQLRQGGPIRDVVTIRSSFGGQVLLQDFDMANTTLEVGTEIKADTPLLRLVDPDRLALVVQVPEAQARFLSEADPVTLHSDDLGPLPGIKGVIGRLAQEINPELRTREVRIYLTGARDVLQPGSLVSARFTGALDARLQSAAGSAAHHFPLIPKTAVLSTGVRHVAWRVAERAADGGLRFELAPLALGPRIEDANGHDVYIVRAGLKAGDEVATQGSFLIDSQAQLAGTASLLFPTGTVAAPTAHQH